MIPPRSCPHPEKCEVTGHCWNKCRQQTVAVTPPPIPLHLQHLTEAERSSGLVRLTEGLQRLLRRAPAEVEPASAPFLPAPIPEVPLLADSLILDSAVSAAAPSALQAAAPSLQRPTGPAQIVPAARGGFVLVVDGALTAVAATPEELARVCREWASGAYL